MSSANPDFWEIPVEPYKLDAFSTDRALWKPRPAAPSPKVSQQRKMIATLRELVDSELTDRQRECVRLYFFEGRTQQEAAEQLGICRRVVSQHLFGIRRNGRQVGGALNRIKKLCKRYGLQMTA